MLDEVEQAVVRPLDVLEHEHDRPLLGKRLEEAPPGGERFLLRARCPVARVTHEGMEMREHPVHVLVEQLLERPRQLRLHLGIAVGLEDAGLRLHHLRERPVADTLAVRQRPALAPVRQMSAALDRLEQLADESALADPRHAGDRDQFGRTLRAHAVERADELLDLPLASDERRACLGREVDAEARPRLHDLPHGNRRFLPLRLDGGKLAVVDRLRRRAIRRLTHENAVHRRGGLQARRRVDDVTRGHAFAGLGTGGEIHQRLTRRAAMNLTRQRRSITGRPAAHVVADVQQAHRSGRAHRFVERLFHRDQFRNERPTMLHEVVRHFIRQRLREIWIVVGRRDERRSHLDNICIRKSQNRAGRNHTRAASQVIGKRHQLAAGRRFCQLPLDVDAAEPQDIGATA